VKRKGYARGEARREPWEDYAERAIGLVNEVASTGESGQYAIKRKLRELIAECWQEATGKIVRLNPPGHTQPEPSPELARLAALGQDRGQRLPKVHR